MIRSSILGLGPLSDGPKFKTETVSDRHIEDSFHKLDCCKGRESRSQKVRHYHPSPFLTYRNSFPNLAIITFRDYWYGVYTFYKSFNDK